MPPEVALWKGTFGSMARTKADPTAFLALVERQVPPDRLELRGWIATSESVVRRGWTIAAHHPGLPLSTVALEGSIGEWLAPVARRAGRWQNAGGSTSSWP